MVDSSDAALLGAVGAGIAAYSLTDGNKTAAVFAAGGGLVVAGSGTARALEE